MKHIAPILMALVLALPAAAQDEATPDLMKRFEKLSKNAQSLLEGWIDDIGPKLDELGPALEDLAEQLGDMTAYHAPEVLENGDILIRRKKPVPPAPPPPPAPQSGATDKPMIDL